MKLYFFILFILLSAFPDPVKAIEPELSVQTGHAFKIKQLGFTNDGALLGSLSEDNSILLWETRSGRQIRQITSDKGTINYFVFHPDKKEISCLLNQKIIITYNYESGEQKEAMRNDTAAFFKLLNVSGTNNMIVCDSLQVLLYNNSFSALNSSFKIGKDAVIQDALLSGDGKIIYLLKRVKKAGFAYFNELTALNTSNLSEIDINSRITIPCQGIDDDSKFTMADDHTVFMTEYQYLIKIDLQKNWGVRTAYAVTEKRNVKTNCLVSVNNLVYTGLTNGDVHIYDFNKNKYVDALKGHYSGVTAIAYHPVNKYIVTGDENGLILLWNHETHKLLRSFEGQSESISSLQFGNDGQKVIIGYVNGDLKFWDRNTQVIKKINVQTAQTKAKLGFNYAITDIKPYVNDSIIEFSCTYAFSLKKHSYDHLIYYQGKWNIKKNQLFLTEIGTNFQTHITISSPDDFYKIKYEEVEYNVHQRDTSKSGLVAVAYSNKIILYRKDKTDTIQTNHQTAISVVKIIDEIIVTAGWDGTIKEWNPVTGKEIITYGICGRSGFYYYLPTGYYFCSKKALKFLAFRIRDRVFPFDQFDLVYNRPDLVLQKLNFIEEDIINQYKKAYEKRVSRTIVTIIDENIIEDIPVIELQTPFLTVKDGKAELTISASDPKTKITRLHVLVNGVQEKINVFIPESKIEMKIPIKLGYETNNIIAFAENESGLYSLKEEINIQNTQRIRKPDLYLITIGSGKFSNTDFNLNYSAKDASDVKKYFERSRTYKNVFTLHFENETVKKEILYEISDFLKAAGEKDHVILFYAGHGLLDDNYDYYLSTYDVDFSHPETNGIIYTDLEEIINFNKARQKLLLIDACHSGELDKEAVKESHPVGEIFKAKIKFRSVNENALTASGALELSKVLFTNTDYKNGTAIISSSGGGELAIEGEEWNNGLFTYAILQGLKNKKADINNDKAIVISELEQFVNQTVVEISNGIQTPNARNENLLNDFIIRR